jgi:hypothetical protein
MRGYHVARSFALNGRDRLFNAMASDAVFPTDGYKGLQTVEMEDVEDPRGDGDSGGGKKARAAYARSCLRMAIILVVVSMAVVCLNLVLNPYMCTPFASRAPLVPLAPLSPLSAAARARPRLVALLGDSMLIDPEWQHYGLQVRIVGKLRVFPSSFNDAFTFHNNTDGQAGLQQRLPHYNLTFVNLGRNAAQMRHARIDVDRWLFNASLPRPFPDAVVLSTDSDISDTDFDALARDGTYDTVKAQYTANLNYVINEPGRRLHRRLLLGARHAAVPQQAGRVCRLQRGQSGRGRAVGDHVRRSPAVVHRRRALVPPRVLRLRDT